MLGRDAQLENHAGYTGSSEQSLPWVSRQTCRIPSCTSLGYNAPEHRILPEKFEWSDRATIEEGLKKLTAALRPWTIDFHVAQNDGTVHGTGSHDKTAGIAWQLTRTAGLTS